MKLPHMSTIERRWVRRILIIALLPYELVMAWYWIFYWGWFWWKKK